MEVSSVTMVTVAVFIVALLATSVRYSWGRHAEKRERIERQKNEILGMIERALEGRAEDEAGSSPNQALQTGSHKHRPSERKGPPLGTEFLVVVILAWLSIGGWSGVVGHFPPWSSAGSEELAPIRSARIAFSSKINDDYNYELYVMDADGRNQTRLTNSPDIETSPAWSPDRKHIAFDSRMNLEDDCEIYVIDADGSNQRRLTSNSDHDVRPAWSPDGNRIAFASNRDGDSAIFIMDADGSNQRRVTNLSYSVSSPAWSPHGTRIAFCSNRDIYVINANGSNLKQLTDYNANHSEPAWSPDGNRIVFSSTRDGHWDIYTMNADGSNVRRLTLNASAGGPAWW